MTQPHFLHSERTGKTEFAPNPGASFPHLIPRAENALNKIRTTGIRRTPMFRSMTYRMLSLLILAAWSSTQCAAQTASTCTFQKVQIQTDYTLVFGINNVGAIVGTYNPTSGSQAAFIRKSGVVTTIYYPGAAMTSGYGINDNGAIVGSYVMPGIGSPNYGFQWTNGTFVNLSFPGSISTSATGINKTGQVVGSYQDSKGTFHGFKYT